MKYRLILLEDEPAASEYFCKIVQMYYPQFEIVGCAENGIEGLALAKKYLPDLAVTDIRMPQMDGLNFIRRLENENPTIGVMVISSYQDFDYARTALMHGAIDYILKPISPSNIRSAMERALAFIEEKHCQIRLDMLRRLTNGGKIGSEELQKHFPYSDYLAVLTRQNGLASRFTLQQTTEFYSIRNELIDLYGRDNMESLLICPAKEMTASALVAEARAAFAKEEGYNTTVLWGSAFPIRSIQTVVKALYRTLNARAVIGYSQVVITSNSASFAKPGQAYFLGSDLRQQLAHFAQSGQYIQIEKLLLTLLADMEEQRTPQLLVERALLAFLDQVQAAILSDNRPVEDLEFMIDDAFSYMRGYADLQGSAIDILSKFLPQSSCSEKIDTPDFIKRVEQYVLNHLDENISLPALCKTFSISQTYLSRLFRKYCGKSFNNYLTTERIEKAKRLLQNEDILVKDVAEMVGYHDPFYFSRIFRSFTGKTPSDFAQLNF